MDQSQTELVVEWFTDLEDRLQHFLKTVPINWNYKAVLPLVSGIIVEAAGLVDSVFRMEFDLSDPKLKRKELRIGHFAGHYEARFSLSSKKTLIYVYPPVLLNPFYGWPKISRDLPFTFKWWDAYNKLKHQRIEYFDECTLDNAVNSLCALHQVFSVLPCFFKTLVAHDMVALKGLSIKFAIDAVQNNRKDLPFLVESKLFATPYGNQQFPDKIDKISGAYYGSKRLTQFVGR